MFTWICPQCGREVPPSYTDCPDCAKKAAEAGDAAAQPAAPPPPPQPAYAPPPPAASPYAPQQAQYAPPPAYQAPAPAPQYAVPPAPRGGLPTWLLALLFALAFVGLGAGIYWMVGGGRSSGSKAVAAVESPAAKPGASANIYQKYIEISGVRFVQNAKKQPEVRFVVTNHSNVDISDLGGNVTVWGRTRNSEEDAAGTFSFKTDVKGFESKDVTVPLNTKKQFIELPDWQNVSTDVQITSPAQ